VAIVERLGDTDATDVMEDHGAVSVIQRPAIDKRLPELMKKYVRDVDDVIFAKGGLIHRQSKEFCEIEKAIHQIASTDVNVVIIISALVILYCFEFDTFLNCKITKISERITCTTQPFGGRNFWQNEGDGGLILRHLHR